MGAPESGMQAAERPEADTLLSAFRTIASTERHRHASVLNYWLSIRGDKEFPPLHDLDPLELSDAGPYSVLLELISGGHDAEIRHVGETLKVYIDVDKIIDAPTPSLLSCIAKKLPIVAISRDFLAFEDEFAGAEGPTRCWVTLLPLSAGGAWVDYVYALVSLQGAPAAKAPPKKAKAEQAVPEPVQEVAETAAGEPPAVADDVPDHTPQEATEVVPDAPEAARENAAAEDPAEVVPDVPVDETANTASDEVEQPEAVAVEGEALADVHEEGSEQEFTEAAEPPAKTTPGFAKLFDSLAGLTGFYGSQPVKVEPGMPHAEIEPLASEATPGEEPAAESVAEEPVAEVPVEEEAAVEEPAAEPASEEPAAELSLEEEAPVDQPVTTHAELPATAPEGTLHSKLTEVRAKADEARAAKLRANAALYEGLAAAYDFALDAEDAPEEYLRLVETQGLKIQLRAPMKPVVKLAFHGMCDDSTIAQLEAVLAWALKEELPRGSLADRLEAEGGIAGVLNGAKKAA
ncbi:MAG: hypothetical protein ABI454_07885 [Sphingomicrobium sp.]